MADPFKEDDLNNINFERALSTATKAEVFQVGSFAYRAIVALKRSIPPAESGSKAAAQMAVADKALDEMVFMLRKLIIVDEPEAADGD